MNLLCKPPCVSRVVIMRNYHVCIAAPLLAMLIVFVIVINISSYGLPPDIKISCLFGQDCLDPKQSVVDSWKYLPLKSWTVDHMTDYLLWTNSSSCILSMDFGGVVSGGLGIDGQKAVCLDADVAPDKTYGYWPYTTRNKSMECLVYSFGINNEWSFDEAMQQFGCRVYAFDPSMNFNNHNHSSKIHYYNLGLGDRDETIPSKSTEGPKEWKMMSLDSIYYKLLNHGSRTIDYLKIDIEGGEWKALPQIMSSGMLNRVRQLGLEVHLIPEGEIQLEVLRQRIKIVKTLEEEYGFIRFDSKYSPWGWAWSNIDGQEWSGYYAYEMAFYNSKLIRQSFRPSTDGLIFEYKSQKRKQNKNIN